MTNNKDYLSQEEIDALLRQSSDDPDVTAPSGHQQVDRLFDLR